MHGNIFEKEILPQHFESERFKEKLLSKLRFRPQYSETILRNRFSRGVVFCKLRMQSQDNS